MADKIAELEHKALEASRRMESLANMVALLQEQTKGSVSNDLLRQLRELRDCMIEEEKSADSVALERSELKLENTNLRKENEKLKYRIGHLLRSLEEAENKK